MRNTPAIVGLVVCVAVLGVAAFFYTGGSFPALSYSPIENNVPSPSPVSFQKIVSGTNSSVTKRVNYLITSPIQLKNLWLMIDAAETAPAIDFSKYVIVAVFAGQNPTTGYDIQISKIEDTATARIVSLTLAKPDGNCITGQAVTAPYELVLVPATSLKFAHQDTWTTKTCAN